MAAKLAFCFSFFLRGGLWVGACYGLSGCGYHAVYGASADTPISVAAGQVLVPDTVAAQAALSGARAELAAAGRLGGSATYPKLVIDVVRVDELSRGIHVQNGAPVAGGTSIGVVVRARLIPAPDQETTADSGDVRRATQLTGDADPRADSVAHDLAARDAAERAGSAAARLILGIPEAADESP